MVSRIIPNKCACLNICIVRTLTWWQKKLLLLTLIGESEQIKRSMTRLYICYQSKFNQMVSRIIPNRCACLSECMVRTQHVKVLFPTKRNCSWNVNFFFLAKSRLEGFVVRVSECSPSGVDIIYLSRVILISCQQLLRCELKGLCF